MSGPDQPLTFSYRLPDAGRASLMFTTRVDGSACMIRAQADDVPQGTKAGALPEQSVVPAVQTW